MRRTIFVAVALVSFSLAAKADSIRVGPCYFSGCNASQTSLSASSSSFSAPSSSALTSSTAFSAQSIARMDRRPLAALLDVSRDRDGSQAPALRAGDGQGLAAGLANIDIDWAIRDSRPRFGSIGPLDDEDGLATAPEPATWMLLLIGLSGMALIFRGRSTPKS